LLKLIELYDNERVLENSISDRQTAKQQVVFERMNCYGLLTTVSACLRVYLNTCKQQVGTLRAIIDEVRQAPVADAATVTVRRLLLLLLG